MSQSNILFTFIKLAMNGFFHNSFIWAFTQGIWYSWKSHKFSKTSSMLCIRRQIHVNLKWAPSNHILWNELLLCYIWIMLSGLNSLYSFSYTCFIIMVLIEKIFNIKKIWKQTSRNPWIKENKTRHSIKNVNE